jgi:hypothetical protein
MKKVEIEYQILVGKTDYVEITDEEYDAMINAENDEFDYHIGEGVYERIDFRLRQHEELYVRDSLIMLGWEC